MTIKFKLLNRSSVTLLPKKPFLDWIRETDKRFNKDSSWIDKFDLREDRNVYLLPEFEMLNDFEEYIKENYMQFFLIELNEFYTDDTLYPKDMSYEQFKDFFEVLFSGMLIDTLDLPLELEEI